MAHGLGCRVLIDIGDKFLDPLPGFLYDFFEIARDAGFQRRDSFVYVGRQPIGGRSAEVATAGSDDADAEAVPGEGSPAGPREACKFPSCFVAAASVG
jgi:hypothetical protein